MFYTKESLLGEREGYVLYELRLGSSGAGHTAGGRAGGLLVHDQDQGCRCSAHPGLQHASRQDSPLVLQIYKQQGFQTVILEEFNPTFTFQ